MATEFSRGKTLVILAIVIGCFAILWPKIFYPMFQGPVAPTTIQQQPPVKERDPSGALCCGVVFESDASSTAFLNELCSQVLKKRDGIPPDRSLSLCHHELMNKCGIDLEDVVKSDVDGAVVDRRLSSKFHGRVRAQNLTSCLEVNFGIDENLVRAKKSYHRPSDVLYPRHMRPERPPHLHPDMMHPALREKGRVIPPIRTLEKQAKPGPIPGMRPPMGGAPHIVSPSPPGSGGMGILMPIYTVGIIVFFLYTMMKIMFKKQVTEDDSEPRIKDFHMDAEHRKYLFSEEYCTGVAGPVSEMTVKEYAILQEQQRQLLLQQQRRSRSRTPEIFARKDEELKTIPEDVCRKSEVASEATVNKTDHAQVEDESEVEEVVEEVIIPRSPKMDTAGKPIGQWYLPPGFDGTGPAGSESADENETGSDIDLNDADERSLRLAFAALKAQKEEEVDQLRRRLEETERAMERICRQMGDVTDKLSTSAVADLLTPQLSSDKSNEELADETGQDECTPCQPEVAVEDFGLKSECALEEEPKESVMISVVQSSEEKQEPVEEDFIEKSAAESESFLRSFVRRLPSERQPSEIFEEEVVIEESLPATSTFELECPVPIAETTVEEKLTSEIEFVQETQPWKQEEEVVEVPKSEIESEPTPKIEIVQEQSATQEEEIIAPYTEEPLKSEPLQDLIKSESNLQVNEKGKLETDVQFVQDSVQEEKGQLPIEETVQETVSSEVESVSKSSETQDEETNQVEETEPVKESSEVESVSKSSETQEEETNQVEETEPVKESSEVESASKSSETEDEETNQVEETEPVKESSEVESVSKSSETQEEETNQVEETEPVKETISSKEKENEKIEEILETLAEPVQQPVEDAEYQYTTEETVEKVPKYETESVSEPEKEQLSLSCIEETVEEEPTQEIECVKEESIRTEKTIWESSKVEAVEVPEEESQLQVEETIQQAKTSEGESTPEKSVVQVEEIFGAQEKEINQLCVEETLVCEPEPVTKSEETLLELNEIEAVLVQEEESQLQVEETVQESKVSEVECTTEASVVQEGETWEPTKEEEYISQTEETAEEQPAQENEYVKEESNPQQEEISKPCIEVSSEPEPVQELSQSEETILESFVIETGQMQEEESRMQVEETAQEAAISEVESTLEASVVQEEEICEPCTEKTQQSEEELVQDQIPECQFQVEKIIEEEFECDQESIKVEESSIQTYVEITEEPAQEKQEDQSQTQSDGTFDEAQEIESTQEITNSEEGESSLMDGETIEEILESEIESGNDLTVAEDEQTNIEDITEDTLEIETEYVPQITDETVEENRNKVEEVFDVENILETQVESAQQAPEAVIEEIQPKVEQPIIQTQCDKLKLEEFGVKSARQGSEERRMTVNVCGMELTACMEDCGKMPTDLLPKITDKPHAVKHEPSDKIPSVFLDTTIPHDSHLVVSEAECSAEIVPPEELDLDENEYESSPVVLSGKMTLSVIGMELNAETPEIQEAPLYTVEEPEVPPRVRFSEPTDRIFLIPVDPEEEVIPEDSHDEFHTEEDDEQMENPTVTYRPPTPPLQHLVDHEDAEFLTYDQLEEVGEVDNHIEEIEQEYQEEIPVSLTPVPESLAEQSTEEVNDVVSKDSTLPETVLPIGIDQSMIDTLESQIITEEEKETLTEKKNHITDVADYVEVIPAADEHASIGQMVAQIRVAMEESASKTVEESASKTVEESGEPSEVLGLEKEMAVEKCVVSTKVHEQSQSVQNALNEMVDTIITESIADSVAESIRRDVGCDVLKENVTASLEEPEQVIHLLSERIDDLRVLGSEKTVMDAEYKILSNSALNAETEDFERNREEEIMEHALEQIEMPVSSSQLEEQPKEVITVNESVSHTELESEPSISGFIIREDFPDDEDTQSMTEEEILQARREIEEIKKLLADVSSGVVHHSASEVPTGSSNIATELAYAMAEDAATAAAASKGSSPDMDEYEVIQNARPSESSEASHEMADSSVSISATTSMNNDS